MNTLFVVAATAVNTLLLAWLVRRVLGVPVAWPRTLVLSLLAWLGATPLLTWVLGLLGVDALDPAAATGPHRVVLSVVAVLVAAWVVAIEVAVLTMAEVIVPSGSLPTPTQLVRSWPARGRRLRRAAQVSRIAARHGLAGYLVAHRRRDDRGAAVLAVRLREALTDGGVTFVKLGQTLATRPDLLPPEYIAELGRLHSDAAPVPWPELSAQLHADLGRPLDEVFEHVDPEPLAAASVAQVHVARLRDGQQVVLKIQRPRARAEVTADLGLVLSLAQTLQRRTDWGRRLGVVALAEGFAASLAEELDYRVELANIAALTRAGGARVTVPKVWPELSGPRHIVMEQVAGEPLSRAAGTLAGLPTEQRAELATALFDSVLRQVVTLGVFHADLHPGNVLLGAHGDGHRVALLDFGSVGWLDRGSRDALTLLLVGFRLEDAAVATDAVCELLGCPDDLQERAFSQELGVLMLRAATSADLFSGLTRLVVRHGFTVPPMTAAAFRSMATVEGSLQLLDPGFDLLEAARGRAGTLAADLLSPQNLQHRAESALAAVVPVLQRLPGRLDRITADLESGRFTVRSHVFDDLADRRFLAGLLRDMVTALLCVALTGAGVSLIAVGGGPVIGGTLTVNPVIGSTLLLFGFVLGARLLATGFRLPGG